MSVISLHRKYAFVDYQNRLCSLAAVITLTTVIIAMIMPAFWIFKVNNNNFSPSSDLLVFEQPMVKFQYKYIFIAEHSLAAEHAASSLCSSFKELQNIGDAENCAKMKVIEKDENFDGMPDEIQISFEFNTKFHYGVKTISLAIFLDSRIADQCRFRIPTALIINEKSFPNNLNDRSITISGALQPVQNHALVCPFFLRNVKSHFFFDKLNENQTNLEEFNLASLQHDLDRNPMSFQFDKSSTELQEVDKFKTSIKIKLRIPQLPIRYRKTFWQNVNEFWINYISIFIVTFVIANYALNHLFESKWLMARRKIYLEKTD